MPRQDVLIARNVNFTATRREWVLGPVPNGAKGIGATIDITGWNDPTARLTVGLETSTDGGTTWVFYCAVTIWGIPGTNPDGTPATAAIFVVNLPPAGVQMKGYAFTNGATVRLPISLVEIT